MKTDTPTLIKALRVLAQDIQLGDGFSNAVTAEAADRLEELQQKVNVNWPPFYILDTKTEEVKGIDSVNLLECNEHQQRILQSVRDEWETAEYEYAMEEGLSWGEHEDCYVTVSFTAQEFRAAFGDNPLLSGQDRN